MKLSLDQNVDENAENDEAREILSNTAEIGSMAVAELILDRKDKG